MEIEDRALNFAYGDFSITFTSCDTRKYFGGLSKNFLKISVQNGATILLNSPSSFKKKR